VAATDEVRPGERELIEERCIERQAHTHTQNSKDRDEEEGRQRWPRRGSRRRCALSWPGGGRRWSSRRAARAPPSPPASAPPRQVRASHSLGHHRLISQRPSPHPSPARLPCTTTSEQVELAPLTEDRFDNLAWKWLEARARTYARPSY
jgi:hypothetical protein